MAWRSRPGSSSVPSDIAAGLLKFTPAPGANGAPYAKFTFQVQDNGGTANGGGESDPTPKTITVNVTTVNDAPTGTNNTITMRRQEQFTPSRVAILALAIRTTIPPIRCWP